MKPQELQSHVTNLGLRLELVSRKHDRFGWDRISEEMKTLLRADWNAALMGYTIEEVDRAIADLTVSMPSKCPNEGHVVSEIMKSRKSELAHWHANKSTPPAPETKRVTPERAAEIRAEIGV